MLKMTEAALNRLKELAVNEDGIPRVDAEVAGGCGITVKFARNPKYPLVK
ncbi:hypothetical protein [Niallia sp. 01092]